MARTPFLSQYGFPAGRRLVSFFATNTLRTDNRIIAGDGLYSIIDCYVAYFIKVLRFVMPGVVGTVIVESLNSEKQSFIHIHFIVCI